MEGTLWLEREPGRPRLAYALHRPSTSPCGAVLLSHGFAEHSGSYQHVVAAWTGAGLLVGTYDFRGHGRSEGPRGHIDDYQEYVEDLNDVWRALQRDEQWASAGKPVLFGHSTGALATVLAAHAVPDEVTGVALSSPYLELALPVSAAKRWLVKAVVKVYSLYSEDNRLDPDLLTHDPEIAERMRADTLRLRRVTAGWFQSALAAQRQVLDMAPSFRVPVYCVAGGADPVAKLETTRRFFERLGSADKELVVAPGARHEVLNEVDRAGYIRGFSDKFRQWFGC